VPADESVATMGLGPLLVVSGGASTRVGPLRGRGAARRSGRSGGAAGRGPTRSDAVPQPDPAAARPGERVRARCCRSSQSRSAAGRGVSALPIRSRPWRSQPGRPASARRRVRAPTLLSQLGREGTPAGPSAPAPASHKETSEPRAARLRKRRMGGIPAPRGRARRGLQPGARGRHPRRRQAA
jgi:hypothetical protein